MPCQGVFLEENRGRLLKMKMRGELKSYFVAILPIDNLNVG